jgi:hypothetical protein
MNLTPTGKVTISYLLANNLQYLKLNRNDSFNDC